METTWEYNLLTPLGLDGLTLRACDEDGQPVAITFAGAQTFQTVIDAITDMHGFGAVELKISVGIA